MDLSDFKVPKDSKDLKDFSRFRTGILFQSAMQSHPSVGRG